MKKLILLIAYIISFACIAQVKRDYKNTVKWYLQVNDTIDFSSYNTDIPNALQTLDNYLADHPGADAKMTPIGGLSMVFSGQKIPDTIYVPSPPEIIRDTVYIPQDSIRTVQLIVTNGYMGPDVSAAFQNNRLKIEYFEGNSGSLENLKNSINNGKVADSTSYITQIKTPQSNPNKDRYGTRVTGYINPGLAGEYTFHCYADDELEFRIWKDDEPILLLDQAFYTLKEQWDKYEGQTSQPIELDANERYRFEVITYEGGGADYFGVGWKKPGDTEIEIIPQLFLTEY